MNGCRDVFRIYCSLIALLVIFWALNNAFCMIFIAKSSSVALYRTSVTLPKAPSPSFLISTKSSKRALTWHELFPRSSAISSSWIVFKNALLSAPIPALNMKEEMPQFVTAAAARRAISCWASVRLKYASSTSGETLTSGTICSAPAACTLILALEACPEGELDSGNTTPAGPLPGTEAEFPNCAICVISRESVPLGRMPTSAWLNKVRTVFSSLSRSNPNLLCGTHSIGFCPCLLMILVSMRGCLSRNPRISMFTFCTARWRAVSPRVLTALKKLLSCPPT
mmetsp:Transcript_60253/g.107037  ORF Transcript_60253/g.107037 Transcript_60253/m.107037 type:complete len:282 (-) Transcript_60253:984-1829(-)